ncbi:MAG: hypothetical protein MJK04_28700 [Psychrosphaera sp.]|nr:hypothetical protein [Psychrosphaera sp.]
MSKLDKDEVIANFTAAYQAANGKEPQVEAKGGWYSVDGGKNIRLAALVDMTAELSGGAAPAAPAEEAKAAPAKKAAPKKAAPKKAKAAPAAAASTGPTVVSAGEGMKPGDFWKSRLESSGQKCTLPSGI